MVKNKDINQIDTADRQTLLKLEQEIGQNFILKFKDTSDSIEFQNDNRPIINQSIAFVQNNKIIFLKMFHINDFPLDFNFNSFNHLEGVSIEECEVKKKPNLSILPKIKTLLISNSNLNNNFDWIENFPNLNILSISNTLLNSLSGNIKKLTNLHNLVILNCHLKIIPVEIESLQNLTRLNFQQNEIENLPDSIGNLINLTDLDLEDNLISNLPSPIGNLRKLYSLNISKNKITNLPDSFKNLTNLQELILEYLNFQEWPTILNDMDCKKLDLWKTTIKSLKNISFSALMRFLPWLKKNREYLGVSNEIQDWIYKTTEDSIEFIGEKTENNPKFTAIFNELWNLISPSISTKE